MAENEDPTIRVDERHDPPPGHRFGYRDDMAGYDESQPPDAEVYIVDGDGPSMPDSPPSEPGSPRNHSAATRGRSAGIVLGMAALFVLGVLIGRTSLSTRAAGVEATATVTITPTRAATALPDSASTRMTRTPAATEQGDDRIPWPSVPGACGRDVPQPLIDGAKPLAASVAMHLIAGGDPAQVDLGGATVGSGVFRADTGHVVTAIATGRDAVVVLVASCDGAGPGRVLRVTSSGHATDVALPDSARRATLISGGDRVWVAVSSGSYGFAPVTLLAADGSGDTVTLPGGLEPLGGVGRHVVGQYSIGGMPSGLFGVLDTDKRSIVRQFGTSESSAMNAIADGKYVVTAPWVCGKSCEIHRFVISTGVERGVRLSPASDTVLSGGGVISPNGTLAAIPLYAQPPSPEPFDPYRLGADSPNAATRVGLVDLRTGTVRALPGLTLGAAMSPALTFSPDGRWIVVAVGEGYRTRLLLYTATGDGPYDPGIDIPGLVSSPPPVVVPIGN